MFRGFSKETFDFMWGIRFNNEKAWFEEHKDEYKKFLAQPMNDLAAEVFAAFNDKYPDLNLRPHVSRIYRDARRMHGAIGPYKDHLWFSLRTDGDSWFEMPTFWFELEPEKWSYGLGFYQAKPITMEKHRRRIDKDPKPIEKLLRALDSQAEFTLEGESYARPKGDKGKLLNDWYNKKNFYLYHEQETGDEVYSPDLARRVSEGFDFLVPFYRYISTLDSEVL